MLLEKILKSPLDSTETKPVNPKGNQPWVCWRTDAEALILWPPDAKSRPIGKDPDAGKGWGWRRRERQKMRWLGGISDSMGMSLSKLRERRTGKPLCYSAWSHRELNIGLHNWTTTICEEDQEHGLSPGHSIRPECSFFGRREWEYLGMGRLCDSRNDPAAKINMVQAVHAPDYGALRASCRRDLLLFIEL